MRFSEYQRLDGIDLAELVRTRKIDARELVDVAVRAIETLNPILNFLVADMPDKTAAALKDLQLTEPFAGVPFLYKDNGAHLEGVFQELGSRLAREVFHAESTELANRFRAAGTVPLGRTTTPEFGTSPTTEPVYGGPSRNPWSLVRSPGGSSGGAAAAVAAGVVPIAHGTDGGGSIRVPAHCCGVFGLKPSRGRNPGDAGLGLTAQHVLTRTVRDSARMLDATCGARASDLYCAPAPLRSFALEAQDDTPGLRIAVPTRLIASVPVTKDAGAALEEAVGLCEDLNHVVVETSWSVDWSRFHSALLAAYAANVARGIRATAQHTGRVVGPETVESTNRALFSLGQRLPAGELLAASEYFQSLSRELAGFMTDFDLLLLPTCASAAPPLGTIMANLSDADPERWLADALAFTPFTALFNATGQPAVSVPLHMTPDGLPFGVQFVARHFDEAALFRVSGQLERAKPWRARFPSDLPEVH